MKKYTRIAITATILILVALAAFPATALAIADPDSPPQINSVYVYEDLLEDGDAGVLIEYYLDYTVNPDENANEAYLAIFIDTDGTTQLKAVAPYVFYDDGYSGGLMWIYFSASEVTDYGIDQANEDDYRVWLVGNPTLSWTGDPPKTVGTIDYWQTSGDASTLVALRVIYYADIYELAWSQDLVEATALGNRLTALGEEYFTNVIPNLRTIAPTAFSATTIYPDIEGLDYSTEFGGVAYGTIVNLTPVTLAEGANTVTLTGTGTFTITLQAGTYGTVTNGIVGVVTGSPADIFEGDNVVTCTVAGDVTVDVELVNTQTGINDTVTGTGFDLTTIATHFGMSRMMFSGFVWVAITIVICAATYVGTKRFGNDGIAGVGNHSVTLLFGICLIGGALLGLLDMRVAAFLVIGYAAFIGYVLFFRGSGGDIGKTLMFLGFMWIVVCLVGGTMVGYVSGATTELTADITADATTITVDSTEGFHTPGVIIIGNERIYYSVTTANTFEGGTVRTLIRGADGTEAVAHSDGADVRMPETGLLNASVGYNLALISDASGIMAFVAMPLAVWNILTSFIMLPIQFMGTDMWMLTVIWGIILLGFLVSAFIAMVGGRRVG